MNKKNTRRAVDAQVATETADGIDTNFVKDAPFGSVRKATFSVTVKDEDKKELYKNENEPYEFDVVNSLINVLRHSGAKFDDAAIKAFGSALRSTDPTVDASIGEAAQKIINIYNSKLKGDAKSSAYQSIVNKYKPLEGEKRDSAMARIVANFIRLGGVSKEVAIAQLKSIKALPDEYTVADFDSTPLRRTKGDDSEE